MQRHLLVRVTSTSLRLLSVRYLGNLGFPTHSMSLGPLGKLPQIVRQLTQSTGMETGKGSPEILASLETVSSLKLSTPEDLKVRVMYVPGKWTPKTIPIIGVGQDPFVQNILRR